MKMKENSIIFLASKLVANANLIIIDELKKAGTEDISPSYGDIFHRLFGEKKLPMVELAKQINKTKATTSVLIDKLEQLGYVIREKCPNDGRVSFVKLTSKGEKLKPIVDRISEKLNQQL